MIKAPKSDIDRNNQAKGIAYNRVFDRQNVFTHEVLTDLAKFCRAHETTFHHDPRLHALMEGRREVFLRIQEYLDLSPDEILKLHKIKNFKEYDNG